MQITIPDNATLSQALRIVADAMDGKSGGGSDDWRTETGFPKVKTINGATIMLYAPVNPEWEPSLAAKTFGQQGRHVDDPSLPPGARSPAGFPLYYNRIVFADESFANEAELTQWRGAVAAQGNQGGIDAQQQAELQPGAQDVRKFDIPQLEWVLQNINAVLGNHGSTHGPMTALHELSSFMSAAGIVDAGYIANGVPNGLVVPPASFPQLATMTVQRAKELAGLA